MVTDRTQRLTRAALVFAFTMSALGCASTSIRSDTRSVADATHMPIVGVADTDVDPALPAEARALLDKPLDADAAVRIAILANRELRAELREMGIPRGRLVQAGVLPNPTFEVEIVPERTSAYSLRAEYDLTGLVLAPIRAHAASFEVDAARYDAAASVIELGYRVRAAFTTAAAAEEELAIANRWLDAFAASRDAAQAIASAGNIRKLDFETQNAAYQEARAEVAEIELASKVAHEALARLLALHGTELGFTLAGALPPAPETLDVPDAVESRVLRASFELLAKKAELEAVGRSAGVARAEGYIPDVSVDVHMLQPRAGVTGVADSPVYSGGLKLTVPIFDRKQGTTAAREAEFDGLLERYYGAATSLRSQTRVARAHLATAHGRARLYESEILPARARVSKESILQYDAMQISVFRLLQARRDALMSELAAVEAKRSYWIARAAFDALLTGGRAPMEASGATPLKFRDTTGGE